LHDANTDILAIAKRRFKAAPHINQSLPQVGHGVCSLIGILAARWLDDISDGKETLMRATCRRQAGSGARRSDTPTRGVQPLATGKDRHRSPRSVPFLL